MIPEGRYDGTVHGHWRWANHFWTGKVFTGSKVVNIIRGRELIEGDVTEHHGLVQIRYPQLGLTDTLWPRWDRAVTSPSLKRIWPDDEPDYWDGSMPLGLSIVRFTLRRREPVNTYTFTAHNIGTDQGAWPHNLARSGQRGMHQAVRSHLS